MPTSSGTAHAGEAELRAGSQRWAVAVRASAISKSANPSGRELTLYENDEGLVEHATDPMGHTAHLDGYENGTS